MRLSGKATGDIRLQAEDEDQSVIATNIERYLNNHIREGGHAYQQNMAARPGSWHPLQTKGHPSDSPMTDP